MTTAHIEHAVQDFDRWKSVFDKYDDARAQHRVRRWEISRPVDDPKFVMIELDFDGRPDAEAFLAFMRDLWGKAQAASVLSSKPQTRITESYEAREL